MDLKEAIASLDARNDDHWTEQGLPRMEVIRELTGTHYSRKEITEAAPMVTRERLLNGENTAVGDDPVAEDAEVKLTKPEATPEPSNDRSKELQAKLEKAEQDLYKAQQAADAANNEVARLEAYRDKLVTDLDNLLPKANPMLDIMAYLESQKKMREERAQMGRQLSQLDQTLMMRRRSQRAPL